MSLIDQLIFLRSAARQHPSGDEAAEAISLVLLGNPYDQLFFSELSDPEWLSALVSAGCFVHLPIPIRHDDGSISYRSSLPLIGLARLAPRAPAEVTRIISTLPETDNLNIGDQIMRVMAEIQDPQQVPALLPVAQHLAGNKSRSTRLFLRDLLKKWMLMNCEEEALTLLSRFVESLIGTEQKLYEDPQTIRELEDCDRHILSPIATKSPSVVASFCFESLSTYHAVLQSKPKKTAIDDWLSESSHSNLEVTHWFEDFRRPNIRRDSIGSILAHRLYVALGLIYAKDSAGCRYFDELLRSHSWMQFQRIRWQLYADFPGATLEFARNDVLERIPDMGRSDHRHRFEFASLLERQSTESGHLFLSVAEISLFVEEVLRGPIDDAREQSQDESHRHHFWRHQLWPIRTLLPEQIKAQFDHWAASNPRQNKDLELDDYKPFRTLGTGGFVRDRSPYSVEQLATLEDSELWIELNTWKATGRWIENDDLTQESAIELARTFADLLTSVPDRFTVESRWWLQINRPSMLSAPLERWADRVIKKTESPSSAPTSEVDLDTAFAVAEHVLQISQNPPELEESAYEAIDEPGWNQCRLSVCKFLNAVLLNEDYRIPWESETKDLLVILATGRDQRLDAIDESEHHDWQFEAINSVRGEAWEGILRIATYRKNSPTAGIGIVPEWIPTLLSERLKPQASESPAIFSFLGSNLRRLSYLLPDWLKANAELFLPKSRPSCLAAAIAGHLAYDQPYKGVIDVLPTFLDRALDSAEQFAHAKNEDPDGKMTDFSSRLGFHIAFYTWNDCIPLRERGSDLLWRFFTIASPSSRAETIGYIGSVFEKSETNAEIQSLISRTQYILDQWMLWIQKSVNFDLGSVQSHEAELGRMADLVAAECFPFKWRVKLASTALALLSHPRWSFQLLETLEQWSEQDDVDPERIVAGISLLTTVTGKMSDELRWSIQTRRLKPILSKGLQHNEASVVEQTHQVIENLLRQGFFELLDLFPESEKSTT